MTSFFLSSFQYQTHLSRNPELSDSRKLRAEEEFFNEGEREAGIERERNGGGDNKGGVNRNLEFSRISNTNAYDKGADHARGSRGDREGSDRHENSFFYADSGDPPYDSSRLSNRRHTVGSSTDRGSRGRLTSVSDRSSNNAHAPPASRARASSSDRTGQSSYSTHSARPLSASRDGRGREREGREREDFRGSVTARSYR
jgi:hypothetical protein